MFMKQSITSFCCPFHDYHPFIPVQYYASFIQTPNPVDRCSNISTQTKLFILYLTYRIIIALVCMHGICPTVKC